MRKSLILLAIAALTPVDAWACTVWEGYRIPTNIELLEDADLVVLGSVDPGPERCEKFGLREMCSPTVELRSQQQLKGEGPPILTLAGRFSDRRGGAYELAPTPLHTSHPSASWGACIRQAYADQSQVIAMFRRTADGQFRQMGEPFARAVEDIEGADSLWLLAATIYLEVIEDTAEGEERRLAFEKLRDELRALDGDEGAHAIADDIDKYLLVTAEAD